MFINGIKNWYVGNQGCTRGAFLIFFQWDTDPQLKVLVRTVTLKQLGHFMMGEIRLAGIIPRKQIRITLSGSLGSDGLPINLYQEKYGDVAVPLWDKLHPLPEELQQMFWADDTGWNSVGFKCRGPIAAWAVKNEESLRKFYAEKIMGQ